MDWRIKDFWKGKDAVFLITAMKENERLTRDLARTLSHQEPALFDGLAPVVYQKLLYCAPFESFEELRRLELQLREVTGLRACYRGIVALDLSEWVGHEQEEYLHITLKYLHDHRHLWKCIFLAGNQELPQIVPLLQTAAQYLRPGVQHLCLFRDMPLLTQYIQASIDITPQACSTLAKCFQEIPGAQNCVLLEQVLGELVSKAANGKVTAQDVAAYLGDDTALLSLIYGKAPGRAETCRCLPNNREV